MRRKIQTYVRLMIYCSSSAKLLLLKNLFKLLPSSPQNTSITMLFWVRHGESEAAWKISRRKLLCRINGIVLEGETEQSFD